MQYSRGANPYMVEGIARACLWTGDKRFLQPLTTALPYSEGGAGYGKGFGSYYRSGPRVLADLEAMRLGWASPPSQ